MTVSTSEFRNRPIAGHSTKKGRVRNVEIGSRGVDTGEAALQLAIAGGGISRVADLQVRALLILLERVLKSPE